MPPLRQMAEYYKGYGNGPQAIKRRYTLNTHDNLFSTFVESAICEVYVYSDYFSTTTGRVGAPSCPRR